MCLSSNTNNSIIISSDIEALHKSYDFWFYGDFLICETNDVEDENHFILFCSKYTGCRQTLPSNIQNDSFHTLCDLEKEIVCCADKCHNPTKCHSPRQMSQQPSTKVTANDKFRNIVSTNVTANDKCHNFASTNVTANDKCHNFASTNVTANDKCRNFASTNVTANDKCHNSVFHVYVFYV